MKQSLLLLLISCALISTSFGQENQWTWMKGDILPQIPVYGSKGVSSPASKPGARRNATIWTDTAGNTWVFGGAGSNATDLERTSLNDLWVFRPSNGQWAWMGGDSLTNAPGVYGSKGIAAAKNEPGARLASVSWSDNAGNLWLFGGGTFVSGELVPLNDLWKFTPSTGLWTWVRGDSIPGRSGIYGVKGVASSVSLPGARAYSIGTTDASGDFWLYGGYGSGNSKVGSLNDLWKFTAATAEWTWLSGDSTINEQVVFGKKGIAAPGNKPGPKGQAASCVDASGNFWLFSGRSYSGFTNDFWKYTASNGLWTWISGDSLESNESVTVYGTKGIAAASNKLSARIGGLGWADSAGDLWFFGGYGQAVPGFRGFSGWFNDLWKYSPATGLWTWISGDNSIACLWLQRRFRQFLAVWRRRLPEK
jgi:N-acetylneuraminic acid mutarotase